jgi:predicted GNAT family N-acyltransferase
MSYSISVSDNHEACFALRHHVFVGEQGVPVEEDLDELDAETTHILAANDGVPVGTARVVYQDEIAKPGAQLHALGFYEKLGFSAYGPVYLDAGIEHRDMILAL